MSSEFYAEYLAAPGAPLEVIVDRAPTSMLYVTRRLFVEFWYSLPFPPKNIGIIAQGGIPSSGYCQVLGGIAGDLSIPFLFVGSLDPIDLLAMALLACPSPKVRIPKIRMIYGGISDTILEICAHHVLAPRTISQFFVEMHLAERRCLDVVESFFPNLDRIVGANALNILRKGRKFNLEGALNRELYGPGLGNDVRRHLLKVVRSASQLSGGAGH